jgi:hypothetical protein
MSPREQPQRMNRFLTVAVLIAIAISPMTAAEHHGQVNYGGLPLPGATVTASQGDKKVSTIAGEDGAYSFPNLADGVWAMQVEMLCFAPLKQDVAVGANAPAGSWEMKLLPIEEIRASAVAAPPAPLPALSTSAAAPERPPVPAARGKKSAAAPSNTPGGFQRAGVNASASAAPTPPAAETPSNPIPGDLNQTATDSLSINGSQNNGAASAFGQSQAFGNSRRGPGSLYNGILGITFDNSALDARPFSLTGQNTPRPNYSHITGSASFGGPLRIPHLWTPISPPNFFVAYQIVRNTNASTLSGLVPTQAQRDGNVAPGIVIPASLISPQAKALLSLYPLPNFDAGARYNYQIPADGTLDQDSLQSRVNKTVGRFNQVFGTFNYQNTRNANLDLFGFDDKSNSQAFDTGVNWMHRFNQRTFTTFRYNFNRLSSRSTPYFANRVNVSGNAGISGNNQEPNNWGPPALSFSSGIASLADGQQSFNRNETNSLSMNTFWSHAPHNVTFGGDFRRQQFNYLSQQNARGNFTFNGASTGSDFGGFLLGIPDTSAIAFGNADKYFRASTYDAYFTDDWRVSPSLTLNAGGRWEYGSPITELYGRLVNLDITPGFAAEAPVIASQAVGALTARHYPLSLLQPDKHAFEPRIGIAWRPVSGSSLVVRAGYGVTYNTSVYQTIANQMAQQSPLSKSLSVQNTPANPLTLANGFNATPGITPNTFAVDPDFRIGYAQTWQASVQRDLPGALVMTATYLGIKGTRAMQAFLPNTFPAGAVNPCPSCQSGYTYLTSNGNSTREAGQFQLRRRLHNGITASAQYVYSKALDDAALGGRGQGSSVIAQNWLDLSAERGRSLFDQRHLLNLQAQYSTGVGVGGGTLLSGWRGTLFKEWTIATQITAGSGLPLTPVFLNAVAGTGVTGSLRPDYTGASLYAAPPGFFLNPAAVRAPAAGQWGNAGRNSIEGPNQFTLNGSLARTFRLRDRMSMDLVINSTNALNHVTYPSWNTIVTSAQFGLPTTANAMRNVQANVRVRF